LKTGDDAWIGSCASRRRRLLRRLHQQQGEERGEGHSRNYDFGLRAATTYQSRLRDRDFALGVKV
jgi:hypothetical protein